MFLPYYEEHVPYLDKVVLEPSPEKMFGVWRFCVTQDKKVGYNYSGTWTAEELLTHFEQLIAEKEIRQYEYDSVAYFVDKSQIGDNDVIHAINGDKYLIIHEWNM